MLELKEDANGHLGATGLQVGGVRLNLQGKVQADKHLPRMEMVQRLHNDHKML